ncbi:hypothetical protein NXS19_003962 [Fusarium pseudograminearum]|nr:hypothetical protein NXS19_003962 [Fusarium pseudograminearum]
MHQLLTPTNKYKDQTITQRATGRTELPCGYSNSTHTKSYSTVATTLHPPVTGLLSHTPTTVTPTNHYHHCYLHL